MGRRARNALIPVLLGLAAPVGAEPIDFVDPVDPVRIEADIRLLAGDVAPDGQAPFASRHIAHPDHDRARAWLVERLRSYQGLTVSEQPFTHDGVDVANIVADLPGKPGEPWVIVGAHYDSTASFSSDWDPPKDAAPGADDNASGVAVVLELARIMSELEWERPVRFILFDAEEEGLQGAWHHARGLADANADVAVMYSLDPVGYNPGDWLFFTYDTRWPETHDQLISVSEGTWLDVIGFDRNKPGLNGDARSDQYPFWEQGYPALHLGTFPQPPSYHTVGDTIDVVDFRFTSEVARVVLRDVRAHARPVAPAGSGCGCDSVGASALWLWPWVPRRYPGGHGCTAFSARPR